MGEVARPYPCRDDSVRSDRRFGVQRFAAQRDLAIDFAVAPLQGVQFLPHATSRLSPANLRVDWPRGQVLHKKNTEATSEER